MCINQFFPITPNGYWAIQMLCVCLPIMLFVVYVSDKKQKIAIARKLRLEELEKDKAKIENEYTAKLRALKEDLEKIDYSKDYETIRGVTIDGKQLEAQLKEEEDRINQECEARQNALEKAKKDEKENKDDDRATKATKSENSTPSVLFLAYIFIIKLIQCFSLCSSFFKATELL
ncbi:Oidioi.mRNA.OKI2018_I69.chr1.g858.t1.cds [Oikopleura dioica]|uniref:Oidioi.mRNA.OKI2018_I69.chr1.g843.t1.cds n=1 Tax=Oikopleura dioica TaxID=34765 RepID=A0ABN7STD3_OIKDI|nr:Oidioi.mRNA.OKI2018_I69.chr1.g843.t1.cds [Oikopleura dioica]CAG5103626.1 Oidioi.mRNA.OKI2018_I69.chr1.g858.t1.cds [Oikopleura dioica]